MPTTTSVADERADQTVLFFGKPAQKCARCSCPAFENDETLFVAASKKDDLGRQQCTVFWFEPGLHDTVEVRRSVPVVRCGHRGQVFHGVIDQHVARATGRVRVVQFGGAS